MDHAEIEVVADGVPGGSAGMEPARLKRALHGGFSSKANGTGLGLSICRHLVGTHGATMNLESVPGQGTTVRLMFPAAPPE